MNRSSKAYGFLIVGWLVLGFTGLITFFGGIRSNDTPIVITWVGMGLGFLLTAIVVAIYDRGPR